MNTEEAKKKRMQEQAISYARADQVATSNEIGPGEYITLDKYMAEQEERHAKQQLAEFTKAAMSGLCAAIGPVWASINYDELAKDASRIARATIDEMIRREKEND